MLTIWVQIVNILGEAFITIWWAWESSLCIMNKIFICALKVMRDMDATRFRFVDYLTHIACLISYEKWVLREKYPYRTCLHLPTYVFYAIVLCWWIKHANLPSQYIYMLHNDSHAQLCAFVNITISSSLLRFQCKWNNTQVFGIPNNNFIWNRPLHLDLGWSKKALYLKISQQWGDGKWELAISLSSTFTHVLQDLHFWHLWCGLWVLFVDG